MVEEQRDPKTVISRRTLVHGLGACAGATVAAMSGALAQGSNETAPPTTITSPPRDFSPRGAPTTYFWDPDIVAVDPSFNNLAQPNTAIQRLHTGLLWAEGPAWSAQGRYLVWSDASEVGPCRGGPTPTMTLRCGRLPRHTPGGVAVNFSTTSPTSRTSWPTRRLPVWPFGVVPRWPRIWP
jgi:hypothetical protein